MCFRNEIYIKFEKRNKKALPKLIFKTIVREEEADEGNLAVSSVQKPRVSNFYRVAMNL